MKYFAGYVYPDNARGFRREYNTRIALYDECDNMLTFNTFAKIKGIAKRQTIRGFENACYDDNELYDPNPLFETLENKNFIVQDNIEQQKLNSEIEVYDDITIAKAVIFDKLFSGVFFVYKFLKVRVCSHDASLYLNITPELISTPIEYTDTETLDTYAECLHELAFCLSAYNSNIVTWIVELPRAKKIDLGLFENLKFTNNVPIQLELRIDTKDTEYLKLTDLVSRVNVKFSDISGAMKTIKELDLRDCTPQSIWTDNNGAILFQRELMKQLLFITNKFMNSFGIIKFGIQEKTILEDYVSVFNSELARKRTGTPTDVYVKYLGSFESDDTDYFREAKHMLGALRLMGRNNTVFVINTL